MVEPNSNDKGFDSGWATDYDGFLSHPAYANHLINYKQIDQKEKIARMNMSQHEKNQLKQPDAPGFSCIVAADGTSRACLNAWRNLGLQCGSSEYAWTEACNSKEIFDYQFSQWYSGWGLAQTLQTQELALNHLAAMSVNPPDQPISHYEQIETWMEEMAPAHQDEDIV